MNIGEKEEPADSAGFAGFLAMNRDTILGSGLRAAAERTNAIPAQRALENGFPVFLDLLTGLSEKTFFAGDLREIVRSPASSFGEKLHDLGFNVSQVVGSFEVLSDAIIRVAKEKNRNFGIGEYGIMNGFLNQSVACAVEAFQELQIRSTGKRYGLRLRELVHDLRNVLTVLTGIYSLVRDGSTPLKPSAALLFEKNLERMRLIIDRTMEESRLEEENAGPVRGGRSEGSGNF